MYRVKNLSQDKEYISSETYQCLGEANYILGELKGFLDSAPYLSVILRLVNIYEAKNSSDIDRIASSFEDIFLQMIDSREKDPITNQVIHLARAINILYNDLEKEQELTMENINHIQELIAPDNIGLRTMEGYQIFNKSPDEVTYINPEHKNTIPEYYQHLLGYINNLNTECDPLIKMAIVHYQFECIHPYKEGNGRIGRIVNTMTLVHSKRLTYPLLNLSNYYNATRDDYFRLLQKCHNDVIYLDEFVSYILNGIIFTTKSTVSFIKQIINLIEETKKEIEANLPKIYSETLNLHFFKYPYTKNELLCMELGTSRTTTTKYLKLLVAQGILESKQIGKEMIYKNVKLLALFDKVLHSTHYPFCIYQ